METLVDLPNDQLIAIADYLHKTSRALLAVALTAPTKSWRATGWKGEPCATSKAILSSTEPSTALCDRPYSIHEHYEAAANWEILDFQDVEMETTKDQRMIKRGGVSRRSLGDKLNDDDVASVLACIDARRTLKQLRLRHLHNFFGHGLEPLRSSTVIEEIDLGLKLRLWAQSHGSARRLSPQALIPIMDSIVDAEGTSLRKLELPEEWKTSHARNELPLCQFLEKFHQFLQNKEIPCYHCHEPCGAVRSQSCQVCFRRVCENDTVLSAPFVQSCHRCHLRLCDTCGYHVACMGCNLVYCSLCAESVDVDVDLAGAARVIHETPLCRRCRTERLNSECKELQSLVNPMMIA